MASRVPVLLAGVLLVSLAAAHEGATLPASPSRALLGTGVVSYTLAIDGEIFPCEVALGISFLRLPGAFSLDLDVEVSTVVPCNVLGAPLARHMSNTTPQLEVPMPIVGGTFRWQPDRLEDYGSTIVVWNSYALTEGGTMLYLVRLTDHGDRMAVAHAIEASDGSYLARGEGMLRVQRLDLS